ncbi:T cell receptor alpha variable 38-2/delta variable 8 [Gadus chalcogrammus]|uniref:T cell receptor alpha variable 38-2/delta variable 8 n=1 Tax=Gadus chalcogrammus TaxID=1042646 RepID=UPI0024C4D158|nr:T cell receptor alpha variable 38-2/delta variable 8 [Gadus chalcogrammus]
MKRIRLILELNTSCCRPAVEMETWLWIIIASLLSECNGEDRVNQTGEYVIATEGLTVSLRCTFETTDSSPSLFWYKQQTHDFPRFMLRRSTFGGDNAPEFRKDRFDAQIQIKSVPLSIQNLQLSDSALYYCALRPTVTGNTDSLYKNLLNTKQLFLYP